MYILKYVMFYFLQPYKGIGGVHLDFDKLILFNRVLSELSDIFNRLKILKVTFEI